MKPSRIKMLALVFAAVCMLFCSCDSIFSTNADNLISPPMLFEDQNKIQKALSRSAGDKISLEYPSSGDFRSAFIFYDTDADGEEEVIAFYRENSEDVTRDVVHINLLDCRDGKWVSVSDTVGEASSIDKVNVGRFSGQCMLVVGWELIRDREKTFVTYSVSDNILSRGYNGNYIDFSTADFWYENAGDELIVLNYAQSEDILSGPHQKASLVALSGGLLRTVSSVELDSRVTGYKACNTGNYKKGRIGYFLDGFIDTEFLSTQILTVDETGKLNNPLLSEEASAGNVHKATIITQDADGDSITEVPCRQPVAGYEDVPESEKIYEIVWKRLNGNTLEKCSAMYFNTALGIKIKIPHRLENLITIKIHSAQNEVTFYRFNQNLENSTEEIFTVRVDSRKDYAETDGYKLLLSSNQKIVTVRLNVKDELCPTADELLSAVEII